tara:strand:+ start:265 stop:438 length:174 start_codon:yes stop_codon:yes gene_type:complete
MNIKDVNNMKLKSLAKNERIIFAKAEHNIPIIINILCPNLSDKRPEMEEAITVPVPE